MLACFTAPFKSISCFITYAAPVRTELSSMHSNDAVLHVQGPPGTGKTRTILGLLAIVLHASIHRVGQVVKNAVTANLAAQPADRQHLMRLWGKACPWVAGREPLR